MVLITHLIGTNIAFIPLLQPSRISIGDSGRERILKSRDLTWVILGLGSREAQRRAYILEDNIHYTT